MPIYPPSIFRNIRTLKVDYADEGFSRNVAPHLFNVELLLLTTRRPYSVTSIDEVLGVPSNVLKYVHLESNLPATIYHSSTQALFDRYPALVLVDLEVRIADVREERIINRFPRDLRDKDAKGCFVRKGAPSSSSDIFQPWWELVVDDVEQTAIG
ncbi:hypothetical protein ONZ45_g2433 [Pleurotus djamor]|nr:hypothetical protein ONZ45_g2433 [Pleurotus djamor]